MVNLFILFWNRQTTRQKATFIVIGLLLCAVLFIGSQKAYYKYKYFKGKEKQVTELLKVVEVKELKIDSLLNTQIVITKHSLSTWPKLPSQHCSLIRHCASLTLRIPTMPDSSSARRPCSHLSASAAPAKARQNCPLRRYAHSLHVRLGSSCCSPSLI